MIKWVGGLIDAKKNMNSCSDVSDQAFEVMLVATFS
jgi:hypothetical protein